MKSYATVAVIKMIVMVANYGLTRPNNPSHSRFSSVKPGGVGFREPYFEEESPQFEAVVVPLEALNTGDFEFMA